MSIHDFLNKIKGQGLFKILDITTMLYLGIVVVVGISSFYLGRYSAENAPVGVEKEMSVYSKNTGKMGHSERAQATNESDVSADNPSIKNSEYFGSKNGKLYYSYGCKAGNRIAKKNIINFSSVSEAEKAGYMPSNSCK
ncbi:MAG: hypothetical protein NTX85_03165 [Candidatus Nomurabacteria bacterium]|nr:hypothetical protein [Candidatus Nomurabacteria bacterium]